MPTIQLIVTGKTEDGALDRALSAVFPATRGGEPVTWRTGVIVAEPANDRLKPVKRYPAGLMLNLAKKMALTARGGPRPGDPPPDLVLAIGDVELHNLGQETLLVAHMRAALQQHLTSDPDAGALLKERCAYHLLRPMVEASFFGDGATLGRAGVAEAHRQPPLRARDVEEFESVDVNPDWRQLCAEGSQRNGPWWRHERHAAEYLIHLTGRPGATRYGKTNTGVAALSSLPWVDVIDTEPSPYLRALFDDLAAWFGAPSPLRPALTPAPLAPTHPSFTAPADRLLRNL